MSATLATFVPQLGLTSHNARLTRAPQLIYLVAAEGKAVPTTALIMLGAIYGLQALIYILHRKFEHIGELRNDLWRPRLC